MAAILVDERGAEVTLVPGGRGEFTIWLDGRKVFDKRDHGDFPDRDAVLAAVADGGPLPR